MRFRRMLQLVAMVGILGASACSKKTTAPQVAEPPVVVSTKLQYQVGPFYADSGYTVSSLEYADGNGVVTKVVYPGLVWRQTLDLKPGDRIYVRAVVDFQSVLAGGVQVVGEPTGFYAGDRAERADGPATVVLMVDQVLK
jgi:hypothetical protein